MAGWRIVRLKQERGDQVETEHRQVGEIVVGEVLALQVGVNEAQPPQPFFPKGIVGQIRDENAPLITDDHIFHLAEPVYQNSDLSSDIPGEFGQLPGQIKSDKVARRYPAAV